MCFPASCSFVLHGFKLKVLEDSCRGSSKFHSHPCYFSTCMQYSLSFRCPLEKILINGTGKLLWRKKNRTSITSHKIHVWYNYPTFTIKCVVNVGKYASHMNPMGIQPSNQQDVRSQACQMFRYKRCRVEKGVAGFIYRDEVMYIYI